MAEVEYDLATELEMGKIAVAQGRQDLETGELGQQAARLKLQLAQKAMKAQEEVVQILRSMPEIAREAETDPAGYAAGVAQLMMSRGLTESASDWLSKSASAREASMKAAKAKFDMDAKFAAHIGSAMEGVQTKRDFESAITGLLATFPDEAEDLMELAEMDPSDNGMSYAEIANRIAAGATTQLEKSRRDQADASGEYSQQRAAESKVRTEDLIPAQISEINSRNAHREKMGDRATSSRAATQRNAQQMIEAKYRGFDPPALGVLSLGIAEQAEVILRAQPALGRTAALKRAFALAEEEGKFAGMRPKVARAGTSFRTPLPMPLTDAGVPDKSKLQPNAFYRGTGVWTNEIFVWEAEKDKFTRLNPADLGREELTGDEDEEEELDDESQYEDEEENY
jgi:hypothetical protein